jgi:hypothetical protein
LQQTGCGQDRHDMSRYAHQACVRCSPIERCYVGPSKGKRD